MIMKTENKDTPRQLSNRPECAAYLGIKLRTLDKYVALGRIPAIKLSQKFVRFDLEQVRAALLK